MSSHEHFKLNLVDFKDWTPIEESNATMSLKHQTEKMHRHQIVSSISQPIRSSKLLLYLIFGLWTLPIIMGLSTSQNISKRNTSAKSFIHNALSKNYAIKTTTRSLQEPSNFPCQPWCVNNLTPWRDPDPTLSQKCNWPNSCKGCPQCDPDFESSEPTPSPTKACLKWCDNHADPWTTKCRWPLSCGGCSQCAESPFMPSPSVNEMVSPTMTPSIRTGIPTFRIIENFNPIDIKTPDPTVVPSVSPSLKSSRLSSESPTLSATLISTENPSVRISNKPTINEDSPEPSITPTISLSLPTIQPSLLPSLLPSLNPILHQSQHPSSTHTSLPSILPSYSPSSAPTSSHSTLPSYSPSSAPTASHSTLPSYSPSSAPTSSHSTLPSYSPSSAPTSTYPSSLNSDQPSRMNSEKPSITPSILSSNSPSNHLSSIPTLARSMNPTSPSNHLSSIPTLARSSYSSQTPSLPLTDYPSAIPSQYITRNISSRPTKRITSKPTGEPTETPTFNPTASPLGILSNIPSTDTPSLNPISKLTSKATPYPTMNPTSSPNEKPTSNPSLKPSQNMITMKLENATFYVNLRSKIEMDERTKKVFQETTKDFLDELDIGTDDINISFIDVVIDSQYQTISNTNERLQILTEKSTISMIIQKDLELSTYSKGNNNNRHLQNFSAYLLVKIIVMGNITSSRKINEYYFNDAVFNAMNQETELYASKLASSSSFFSDVVNNEIFSKTDAVSEGSVILDGPLLPSAIAVGVIVGSLVIVLCSFIAYYTFRKPYQKRWRNHRPIAEVWPSFSSWNSSKLSLSRRNITSEKHGVENSLTASRFPRSVNITSQDSFSTLSNYGILVRNSDRISQGHSIELQSILGNRKLKSTNKTESKRQISSTENSRAEKTGDSMLDADMMSIDHSTKKKVRWI